MRPVCQPVSVCMSPLQFSPHCWLVVMGERRVMYKYIASPQQALCSTPLWWQMATGHLSQDPSRTARQVGRRGSVVSIGTCRQATFLKKAISNFKHSVINRKPFKTAAYGEKKPSKNQASSFGEITALAENRWLQWQRAMLF